MVRFSRSASVHRGCVHWRWAVGSTSCVEAGVFVMPEV